MAAAARAGSVDGSSSSAAGLPRLPGFNSNRRHPEHWTLPKEWNIEKREAYDSWKVDLQCQISHIDKKLFEVTSYAPQADIGIYPQRTDAKEELRLKRLRDQLRGRMEAGLRRS